VKAIGITAAIERAAWTVWADVGVNISQRTYSQEVEAAGGVPLVLPVQDAGPDRASELLDHLAGLILSGGSDLDPASYGAEPTPETTHYTPERDAFELALARAALERDVPVLGICRGMQLLNVARGGTLQQQVPDPEVHLHTPGEFADHEVRLEPGSLAARAVGAELLSVRSHHHQGVDRLGDGVVATGWAEPGGLVEAIELPGTRFGLGVLWHAEEEPGSTVVTALCEAARATEAVA
jgi:putative glutamine amidotransferase